MKKLFTILSICLCSTFMSCQTQTTDPTVTKMYQLTEADSGKTLEVNIGEEINITLPDESEIEDWQIIRPINKEFLKLIQNQSYGGKQYISFSVIGTGNVLIVFKYRRATEVDVLREFPTYVLIIRTKGIEK